MLRYLRPFPPGWDAADVAQHVRAVIIKRHAEGYEGSHLWMRAWGDTKDALGKDWRLHFRAESGGNHASGRPEGKVETKPAGERDAQPSHDLAYEPPDQTVVWDVREAVGKLDARTRLVVEQCCLQGRLQSDVGAELGLSVETIKKILMKARKELSEHLGAYADG